MNRNAMTKVLHRSFNLILMLGLMLGMTYNVRAGGEGNASADRRGCHYKRARDWSGKPLHAQEYSLRIF